MKTYQIKASFQVSVEVPDNFPEPAYVSKICHWKSNNWIDGRYPFSLEMAQRGVGELVEYGVMESAFSHTCELFSRPGFVSGKVGSLRNLKRRDREVKELQNRVHIGPFREIDISVTDVGSTLGECTDGFVVSCKSSVYEGGNGRYELATRHVFASFEEAQAYADTCNESRDPIVISGRFHQLRLP